MGEIRILHVEDNLNDAQLISRLIKSAGLSARITLARDKEEFLEAIHQPHDLILCDYSLPGFHGRDALELAKRKCPQAPFIFLSGTLGEEAAVESLKSGAVDYVLKDRLGRLVPAVRLALTVARDRVERLKLEQELRQRAMLLDLTDDAVLVFSIQGAINFCNKGAERLYGWTCDELQKTALIGSVFQSGQEWENLRTALSTHREWRGELIQKTRSGTVITTDSRAKLTSADSILFVARDITERKNLEKQFLRAQRLESVGALTSGIAHDLNNILTPIVLGSQVLPAKLDDPEYTGILQTLQSSANRAAEVVRQLLSFARGLNTKPTVFKPELAAGEVFKIAQPSFPKSISLNLNIPHAIPQITADPTQIHQVLLNLIVNARDAIQGREGHVVISVERVSVSPIPVRAYGNPLLGEHVKFSVKDNGPGIPPEVMEHLFQPFFTTKPPPKGTGLGLSTALVIVKAHNGFFTVESDPAHGTDFSFYLPVAKPHSTFDRSKDAVSLPSGSGELVLFVDDEQAIGEMAKVILRIHGYRPVITTSPEDALTFFAENQNEIEVLITDMGMPGMSGVELAHRVLKIKPATKVLICSGNFAESKLHEIAPPTAKLLLKPWTSQEFLQTLQKLLEPKKNPPKPS
jgi:two-component system cell cycle sensor histidine kinase/response regulator CckA